MTKIQITNLFWSLDIEIWDLFVFWYFALSHRGGQALKSDSKPKQVDVHCYAPGLVISGSARQTMDKTIYV